MKAHNVTPGNCGEALFRLSDDFVLDMYVEVMNVHARLGLETNWKRRLSLDL